jgi:hypothetical protein
MHVTIHTTVVERTSCLTCNEDEEASPGAYCTCTERDVELEVVADVGLDEARTVWPFGRLSVPACIDILSIREVGSRFSWSPLEVRCLEESDKENIDDALWEKYLDAVEARVERPSPSDGARTIARKAG